MTDELARDEGNLARTLDIRSLTVAFRTPRGRIEAVSDVSLSIDRGKTLGLVGESGSGKSVSSLAVTRLLPPATTEVHAQRLLVSGQEVLSLSDRELSKLRGLSVGMVFQEPMTALNPTMTVGGQIAEMLKRHLNVQGDEAMRRSVEMLDRVHIPEARRRALSYPHEMSGGMRQRVMIAMALCCNPSLVIADEPTTALDVTIQAQVLNLIGQLTKGSGVSVLLVSHDFGVIATLADDVAVMYAGQVVEVSAAAPIFDEPLHPYSKGLLKTMPPLGSRFSTKQDRLPEIAGNMPSLYSLPEGCRFANRCPVVHAACQKPPPMITLSRGRQVRCWLYADA